MMPYHDSQGVSGRERRSKGNHGIEPSEAASKGWRGAGWLRPISTAPAFLPPCSPDLSSSEEDEVDTAADRTGSRISNNSDDGRRSSNTDQTAVSDTPTTPGAASPETPPRRKREASVASVYHDVEEDPGVVGTYVF